MEIKVGNKIKFTEEVQKYTVIAANDRFAICTKPFNPKKTVIYSIIDIKKQIRGTENLIFGFGAETKEQCEDILERLTTGESKISHRNWTKLNIDWIK